MTQTSPSPAAKTRSKSFGSDTLTAGIRVRVTPFFVPDQSSPEQNKYFFAYRIVISNESDKTVQLLSRHWIVIDADGEREDVRGEGVVGESPIIPPGEAYTYSSACPLPTAWGTMEGTYHMRDGDGVKFDVRIGRFVLTMDAKEVVARA